MLGGGAGGDATGKPAFSLLSFLSSEGQLLAWRLRFHSQPRNASLSSRLAHHAHLLLDLPPGEG